MNSEKTSIRSQIQVEVGRKKILLRSFLNCDLSSLQLDITCRAVARSENPGGLVVLGGDNVPPLVEIGLTDLPKTGGLKPPQPPRLQQACCMIQRLSFFPVFPYFWFHLIISYRPVASGGAGGARAPPVFGRSVNPISTRGGHIIPTQYYVPSRIFRPCDGPVMH